jgi:hypothetical protein
MMSKKACLTNSGGNLSHVMFFFPTRNPLKLGANLADSPVSSRSFWFPDPDPDAQGNPMDQGLPPLRTFVVAVPTWSDGTSASMN